MIEDEKKIKHRGTVLSRYLNFLTILTTQQNSPRCSANYHITKEGVPVEEKLNKILALAEEVIKLSRNTLLHHQRH